MDYLDKHSTLDPVMVSVVSSIPIGGNILNFKPLDVNFGLKCKFDLILKKSLVFSRLPYEDMLHCCHTFRCEKTIHLQIIPFTQLVTRKVLS